MDSTIQHWFSIIETMQKSNTYKPACGRAMLEICYAKTDLGEHPSVKFH